MLCSQVIERLVRWSGATGGYIREALADAFAGVGSCGHVEQPLVLGGILQHGFGFAVYRQDDGALGVFELLDELGRFVWMSCVMSIMGGLDRGTLSYLYRA